jgi:MFS family permease
MTSLMGSAVLVAPVQASIFLLIVLFLLAAGAIADKYHKRAVMLVAQAFMIAVLVVLAGCASLGLARPGA